MIKTSRSQTEHSLQLVREIYYLKYKYLYGNEITKPLSDINKRLKVIFFIQ